MIVLVVGGLALAGFLKLIGYKEKCPSCKSTSFSRLSSKSPMQHNRETYTETSVNKNNMGEVIGTTETPKERVLSSYVITSLNKCDSCGHEVNTKKETQ
jgi:hypothetical protein